jgi:hypothetical protein
MSPEGLNTAEKSIDIGAVFRNSKNSTRRCVFSINREKNDRITSVPMKDIEYPQS